LWKHPWAQTEAYFTSASYDLIVTNLGDNDIKSTTFTSKSSKIDPVLRLFPGAPNDVHFEERPEEGEGQWNNMQVCVCQVEV